MKRFFITGTDTDCGKTYVTCALLRYFNQYRQRAIAIKPIASGCTRTAEGLINEDAYKLQKLTDLSLDAINPWRFEPPVSPHIAAEWVNKPLNIHDIAEYCMHFSHESAEILFIEGCGGLMVPLTKKFFLTTLLKKMEIPVILIVGMKTGCINHALLTQSALELNGLKCMGWIANSVHPKMCAFEENIATLKEHLRIPFLGSVGYGEDFNPSKVNSLI